MSEKQQFDFTYYFYSGSKEKLTDNLEAAASSFSKCIQIDKNSAAAHYELANIYYSQKRMTEALIMSKKANELDPTNVWYAQLYCEVLQKNKQYKEAVTVYERTVKANPEKVDLLFELANAYIQTGKYNDAIKTYDLIESKTGLNEDISLQKQKLYLRLNNLDKAANEIRKLIQSNPRETKYYGYLADLYSANGQSQKAYEELKKILELDPENPYAHLALADYYRSVKNKEQSYLEIKKAFESPELDIDTKVKILLSYLTITSAAPELKAQADELIGILIKVHPKDAKAYSIAGDFYYQDKKLAQAADAFEKALEFDKEKFPIWNQLILIYSELTDFDKMYSRSKEASELFPTQPTLFLLNGIAAYQKKMYKEAATSLKTGANLVIDNNQLTEQFNMYLGDTYHALNDFNTSDDYYEKVLKINPNNIYVLNNYGYYLSLRSEKLERAAELSLKANELEPNQANYQDTYGWILYKQKKYEDAKIWLEKAVASGGAGNGVILEHLGDIYFQLNKLTEALEYWEKAKGKTGVTDLLEKKIKDKKLYE